MFSRSAPTISHLTRSTILLPARPARLFSSTPFFLHAKPLGSSDPEPASYAYAIPPPSGGAGPSRSTPQPTPTRATTESPNLSLEQKQVIDRIIRVDQAGELGANWIYRGQKAAMALRGDWKAVKQIEVGASVRFMVTPSRAWGQ